MPDLSVEYLRFPVFGHPLDPQKKPATFLATVKVSSSLRTRIGAILAAWQVTRQTPLAGRSFQECWTWAEPTALETIVTEVQTNDVDILPGDTFQTQFTLMLPSSLPPSIDNDFERVVHTLHVSIFSPAPDYSTADPTPSRDAPSVKRSLFSSFTSSKPKPTKQPSTGTSTVPSPFDAVDRPSIANHRSEMTYVMFQHEQGVGELLSLTKVAGVEELGIVRVIGISNVMTLGGGFGICLRIEGLNPSVFVHTAQIRLLQITSSIDGTEEHLDEWVLYKWYKGNGYGSHLWPDLEAIPPRSPAFPPRATADSLHLATLARLPSPACGARVTTGRLATLSSTSHRLIIQVDFGVPESRQMKKVQLKFNVTLEDCTMTYTAVHTPRYSMAEQRSDVDVERCMDPYPAGTEPLSCRIDRTTWIVRDGKRLKAQAVAHQPARTRAHQLETSSLCGCFYEDTTSMMVPPGGSLTDHLPVLSVPEDEAAFKQWRTEVENDFLARSERKHVPGFFHAPLEECLCQMAAAEGSESMTREEFKADPATRSEGHGQ